MTPEGRVKADVKKYLASRGFWWTMPMGTGYGRSGVPDFLVCANGRFVAIETKATGKLSNTTAMQKLQIAAINASGGLAVVIDDVEQLKGVL